MQFVKHRFSVLEICRLLKKTLFLKVMHLSLQWMVLKSIVHELKSPKLKILIYLLEAQKLQFVLLQRNLISFLCFCKRVAMYFRL